MAVERDRSDEKTSMKIEFLKSELIDLCVRPGRASYLSRTRTQNAGLEVGCLFADGEYEKAIELFFAILRGEK